MGASNHFLFQHNAAFKARIYQPLLDDAGWNNLKSTSELMWCFILIIIVVIIIPSAY